MKHHPLPIPATVVIQTKDWEASLAYSYGPETPTWRLGRGRNTRYLKVAKIGWEPSLIRTQSIRLLRGTIADAAVGLNMVLRRCHDFHTSTGKIRYL